MSAAKIRILVTGINGQVGGELLPLLSSLGDVLAPARAELDLADPTAIRAAVRQFRPHWIVNPAAYTAVDRAESEPVLAQTINTDAPRILGEEAAQLGTAVIHFSTDYVFNGSGATPWKETDATNPLNVYGASKLAGEQALARTGARHIILRTSWVYSSRGKNFLHTILRLAAERDELRIVDDQYGAPTCATDLADLVRHIITRAETQRGGPNLPLEWPQNQSGLFHAASAGETTWFGFAQEFLRLAQAANPAQRFAHLVPIKSTDFPTPARRPTNSRLDCTRVQSEFGFNMPAWQDAVARTMAVVLGSRR